MLKAGNKVIDRDGTTGTVKEVRAVYKVSVVYDGESVGFGIYSDDPSNKEKNELKLINN